MPTRETLPATRDSKIHKIVIDDVYGGELDLYVITGYYEDGRLGEIFVSIGKQGSTLQGMLDSWAKLLSIALQYGMPLEEIAGKFIGNRFPPHGKTSDGIECTSLIDCVMRYLTT